MTTQPGFNVLDRTRPIYRSTLLEASAGTGKTFSIENLIVRFLLEGDPARNGEPCVLSEILVVTFTRAATRELKARVRAAIDRAQRFLSGQIGERSPDYLKPYAETGSDNCRRARLRLSEALATFDQAQIFTLHGFCSRMLRDYLFDTDDAVASRNSDEPLQQEIIDVIKNFLRTEMRPELCSAAQLRLLMGYYQHQIDSLLHALYREISKGVVIATVPRYKDYLTQFQLAIQCIRDRGALRADWILEDFLLQRPAYKKCGDEVDLIASVQQLAEILENGNVTTEKFDSLISSDLLYVHALAESNRRVRVSLPDPASLHYPELYNWLEKDLLHVVTQARDVKWIFACLASECQELVTRYFYEEEKGGPDQLLIGMEKAIANPKFVERIRKRYRVAIVDEFQDTDPVQWRILQEIYLDPDSLGSYLILVGDPKQSIYAFRQADIYTYLEASNRFSEANRATLTTNYRSQPSLVKALNHLFSEEQAPGYIALPRQKASLVYESVAAAPHAHDRPFSDGLGAIHFMIAKASKGRSRTWPTETMDQTLYFPEIARQIGHLVDSEGFRYRQMAILVRDRHQAEDILGYLKSIGIPAIPQRQGSLCDSLALDALTELLHGVLWYRDNSAIKQALGGQLIGWSDHQVRCWDEDEEARQVIYSQFSVLHDELVSSGIAQFFEDFLRSSWHEDGLTVLERLLGRLQGNEVYRDLSQIVDLLVQQEIQSHCSPQELIRFLSELPSLAANDDECCRIQEDPDRDAVRILTMHVSKGLEFDIVFALGLAKRTQVRDLLILDPVNRSQMIVADVDSEGYQAHLRELDAEKARQAYVAMTRARFRLYVPIAIADGGSKISRGEASPIELLIARFGHPQLDEEALYAHINSLEVEDVVTFIDRWKRDVSLSYQELTENDSLPPLRTEKLPVTLVQPRFIHIVRREEYITSFSSLSGLVEDSEGLLELVQAPPSDFYAEQKNVHTLPAGRETGVWLHELLENVRYEDVRNMRRSEELIPWLRTQLTDPRVEEWYPVFAELVYNALKTPLTPNGFALCETDSRYHLREAEFLYPSLRGDSWNGVTAKTGFMKGVIDLIALHDGRYYVVDWKGNWLGPSEEYYQHHYLNSAMRQHHYRVQGEIYLDALRRYVKAMDHRPFEECFGGVCYLFLRGPGVIRRSQDGW